MSLTYTSNPDLDPIAAMKNDAAEKIDNLEARESKLELEVNHLQQQLCTLRVLIASEMAKLNVLNNPADLGAPQTDHKCIARDAMGLSGVSGLEGH